MMARVFEIVELSGPHLMLADSGSDYRFAVSELIKNANRFLGKDVWAFFVLKWVFVFPGLDLIDPSADVGFFEIVLFAQFDHAAERLFDFSDDRMVDDLVFVVLGSVDVEMNNLSLWSKSGYIARDAVVESNAEGKQ